MKLVDDRVEKIQSQSDLLIKKKTHSDPDKKIIKARSKVQSVTIDISGEISSINQGMLETLKLQPTDLKGQQFFDHFTVANLKVSTLSQLIDHLKEEDFQTNITVQKRNADGQHIELRLSPIPTWGKKDRLLSLHLIGENLSDYPSDQSELERTNAQLKELFDNSYDLIQVFNSDGVIRFANEAWKNKLGYNDDDLKTLTLRDVVHEEHWEKTQMKLNAIAAVEGFDKFETVLISKYGKNIFVSGKIHCTSEAGKPIEFRGIFYDISERIRAEKAQSLFYKIANLTTTSYNLDILYASIYLQLNSILKVQNFAVALKEGGKITFPYYISEASVGDQIKQNKELGKVLAQYTFERKKPLIIYEDGIRRIAQTKRLKLEGPLPFTWLGVQLIIEGQPKGVISFHSFRDRPSYNHKDLELLDFISSQMSMAIERKLQEIQIKNQNARIKAIFESSTHEIWSLDKNFNITSFNQNYANTLKKYYNVNVEEKLWGQNRDKHVKLFGENWVEKYERAFDGEVLNFQTELSNDEGDRIWRDIFINPIQNSDGDVEEVSVIANDITEKKLSEIAVAESEEKFRTIFESIQDIYFRCDLSGKIVMISPSVSEVLGYGQGELLGSDINSFYSMASETQNLFEELSRKKRIKNLEATLTRQNGEKLQCLCNVRMIFQKNRPAQIEGVARDISQIKKAYEELELAKDIAERSLKVKERFLANMSHEIRTPMNGIIGMIDLIASTKLDDEQQDYVKTIKKSSETLLHILNDILDLSKIEAGKMELRNSAIKLEYTFEKLYDLFSRQALMNDNTLYYHLADNLPEIVIIDETRLLQILSNLTSNAIKFSKSGGTIHISAKEVERNGNQSLIRVQIKDSGIGISEEDQDRLFTSFTQVDSSITKNYGGTGLGLAISKELAKSMSGDIGVHSTLGLGSTFWFTFKAEIAPQGALSDDFGQSDADFKNEFENKQPTLLIVDDNSVNRKVASQILKKAGCIVEEASSGMEAIELAKANHYDLIFMDIQMPEMDGIQTTQKIRTLDLAKIPPVIAMTAYSMEDDRSRFLSQGMDDYIPKPIKAAALISKVKDWLKFVPKKVTADIFIEDSNEDEGLIINQNTLSSLSRHGGKDILQPILEDFDRETQEQLVNCFQALQNDDYEGVRQELHTMKGSAGTLGIERVAKCAEKIEAELKKSKPKDLKEKLDILNERFKEFQDNSAKVLDDSTIK